MNWKTCIVSLCFATSVLAGDDFKSANALYDAGKFANAAAVYETIQPKTAAVLFNLGNAHFRQEELGIISSTILSAGPIQGRRVKVQAFHMAFP